MPLTPSAYVDSFARDHLPPADQWPVLEFTTAALQYPERLNAAVELIDTPAQTFGSHRTALVTPQGEVWTYGQLRTRSDQIAQVLTEDLGLVAGNRVLLRAPNSPWTVAAWLGILKAGGIVVTTFAALRTRELTPVIEKTQPRLALVDQSALAGVEGLDLPITTIGTDGDGDLIQRCAAKSGEFTPVLTAADDVALFCPTSGTTGTPKITTHFHRDVLSIDNTFGRHVLRLGPDDLVACTAPFAFTFGLGILVVFTLRAGATALLTDGVTPPELAELVAERGVTVLATAPTAYKQIIAAGKLEQLKGLRAAVSAGEHMAVHTWRQIERELGLRVIDGIGGTEVLHIYISATPDEARPGATGKPLPGYRAAILDSDGNPLPPGQEGRLAVIGPVGCRYLDDERQRDYVKGGWNVTGDTFMCDEDGYYWYRSRTDNIIVSSGYNISGPEVEAVLELHGDVREAAVVARPDEARGSVVCAFVVLNDGVAGDDAKAKQLQDFVKRELAPYKYPRDVRFVDSLPRNTSGKLQHFRLREGLTAESMSERATPDERTGHTT
jgi:2-aminobenzoate-CoA ligase